MSVVTHADLIIFPSESAAVPGGAPAVATGKLWVRDDTPNVIVFTDDAGTDFVLGLTNNLDNNFVYAYDTTTQNISVEDTFQDLTFNTNDQLDGWTHVTSTNVFGCNLTAKYEVIVEVHIEKTGGGAETLGIRALFNSVEVPASHSPLDILSSDDSMFLTSTFFVDGITDQNLEIEIAGSETTVQVIAGPNPGSATTNPSAKITIKRIT